jgi:hypothetical protein
MTDQQATAPADDPSLTDEQAPIEDENNPANEERDLHDGDRDAPVEGVDEPGDDRDIARVLRTLHVQPDLHSRVFDFRGSTSPNGGRIALRACVHHIPVVTQKKGRDDLDLLRRVLQSQGLMVQFGTDAEGNVAIYTAPNRLCFHARGANAVTCGIEHMHFTTSEGWLKKQFRAAGWIAQLLERDHGIPLRLAQVEPAGSGRAQITRTGHTTHEQISRQAGFHDRSDPGSGFDFEEVFAAARFFKKHGHFVGA